MKSTLNPGPLLAPLLKEIKKLYAMMKDEEFFLPILEKLDAHREALRDGAEKGKSDSPENVQNVQNVQNVGITPEELKVLAEKIDGLKGGVVQQFHQFNTSIGQQFQQFGMMLEQVSRKQTAMGTATESIGGPNQNVPMEGGG